MQHSDGCALLVLGFYFYSFSYSRSPSDLSSNREVGRENTRQCVKPLLPVLLMLIDPLGRMLRVTHGADVPGVDADPRERPLNVPRPYFTNRLGAETKRRFRHT